MKKFVVILSVVLFTLINSEAFSQRLPPRPPHPHKAHHYRGHVVKKKYVKHPRKSKHYYARNSRYRNAHVRRHHGVAKHRSHLPPRPLLPPRPPLPPRPF